MRSRAFHPRTLVRHGRSPRRAAGTTLIEVVLAMAITALIGSAVAGLIYSMCQNTRDQQIVRRRNIRADVIAARLDGAIRSSAVVLATGDDYIVLWKADTRANNTPNWSEIERIEWDRNSGVLSSYRAPETLPDGLDLPLDPSLNFDFVTRLLRGTPAFPGETWFKDVVGWQLRPSGASRSTRLLCYTMDLEDDAGTSTFKSTIALRGQ
jgi:type II secretory pathway component PulJ